jgi:hypothetical protein
MLFLVKNSLVKKKYGNVRCRYTTASSFVVKVRVEVFARSHAVAVRHHSSMRNWVLACQDEFFVNNRLDVKENDERIAYFAPHLSRLFRSDLNRACVRLVLPSPNSCLIIARISVTLFPRFPQNLTYNRCFLWGTDKPIELSWVLNEDKMIVNVQNCDSYINIPSSQTYR